MPVDIPYTPLANLRHCEESGTNKATVPPDSYTFAKKHRFRRQRHRQRTPRFTTTITNHISPQITLTQISRRQRQSPKQEHKNEQLLRTLHGRSDSVRLQQTGKHLLHILHIQCPAAVCPRTCIYGSKKMRHV